MGYAFLMRSSTLRIFYTQRIIPREVISMGPDYKSMYFELFNEVSKIIEELQAVQQKLEEKYISADND